MNALTPMSEATAVLSDRPVLPDHPLFAGLTRSEAEIIAATLVPHVFKDEEIIRFDGTPDQLIGIVRSGAVAHDIRAGDKITTVGLHLAGDLLSHSGPRTASVMAVAVDRTEILGCTMQEFNALLARFPRLQLNYLDLVTAELQATRDWYTLLGRKTATERVATLILRLSRQPRAPEDPVIDLLLTRERIGSLLGIKMETVSRQIRAFAKAGVIALFSPTKIAVLDPTALVDATGDIWRENAAL
ncbi:Crp/Fnr family transcriptional regulator [Donghicola mangrovi]|uniref:Crp/Fnr family transcriptional regulator n=1 Tax=Donghicola mangrovi TaxID=2729614 RepID=A0A850QE36_9RHOB|nr:Crp/Fnr family transcriptional regulator [Donghicola mangrovi]NVO25180.1 Crp/Fnr family transcriptional regulator [Donghicola mangrovi]